MIRTNVINLKIFEMCKINLDSLVGSNVINQGLYKREAKEHEK